MARKQVCFMTGGTGFVGSFLAIELLKRGHFVIFLARGKGNLSAKDRIDGAIKFVNPDVYESLRDFYRVVEGEVTQKEVGLSYSDKESIVRVRPNILHVAGSVSFDSNQAIETFETNVVGTRNVLELAEEIEASEVHIMSSAYSCGKQEGVILEDDMGNGKEFNNPYERTKHLQEKEAYKWSKERPWVKVFIHKPSIVVGRFKDGKILKPIGYVRAMRAYYVIKKWAQSNPNGTMKILNDGRIELPIRVPGKKEGLINIVSIDYVVKTILALFDKGVPGIYHITASQPQSHEFWLRAGCKFLGITGVKIDGDRNSPATSDNIKRLENGLYTGLEPYLPYFSAQQHFSQENVKKALGKDFNPHPAITEEFVFTLLRFAEARGFK
ncbi:SDR family oxidoreductase [Patescibacteria group bacterium]|nr:SDR family oxidoreductase [Patescibacteria group bacterium]MBU2068464.1 SDR family oxidoreductase [Patescibacteria group bacterium]